MVEVGLAVQTGQHGLRESIRLGSGVTRMRGEAAFADR